MHNRMYANQSALSDADLDRYAQIIGLDLGQFDTDRSSPEIAGEVTQDKNLGFFWASTTRRLTTSAGVQNSRGLSLSVFQHVIAQQLAQP